MLGRLKNRIRRAGSSGGDDSASSSQWSQGPQRSWSGGDNGGNNGSGNNNSSNNSNNNNNINGNVVGLRARISSSDEFLGDSSNNNSGMNGNNSNHAKLSGLASFDACVEACDALAASSSYAQSSMTRDKETGMKDCSVIVSPDGDLLLLPQQQSVAAPPNVTTVKEETDNGPRDTQDDEQKDVLADEGEPAKTQEGIVQEEEEEEEEEEKDAVKDAEPEQKAESNPFAELRELDEYAASVVMGNDLRSGGDKSVNGFSAIGWSAAAASLAARQTERIMREMTNIVEEIILSQKERAARTGLACDQLRSVARIGPIGHTTQSPIPPTPSMSSPSSAIPRNTSNSRRQKNAVALQQQQALQSLLDIEPHGSYWRTAYHGSDPQRAPDIVPNRVGPVLYPGSSLHNATIAFEQYHAMMAENDSNRMRRASMSSGVLPTLRKEAELTAERAFHREKALRDMQKKANDGELRLMHCKEEAKKRWDAVHEAEEKVTSIVEQRMLERSRERERRRLEQLREEQVAHDKGKADLGATAGEIWELVSSVTESMEDGSFTPIGLPQAPVAGPRDQSFDSLSPSNSGPMSSPSPESKPASPPQYPQLPRVEDLPVASRVEIEQECQLPELRSAAMQADEAVEDAAQYLLNVLSGLDTTRRSARVAVETGLLSACSSYADCIRSLVALERSCLEDRLRNIEDLEHIINRIDVRDDLNEYITADRKARGGSSWMGEDDDGGVASALAVLSSHVDGSMGMGNGFSMRARVDSEGWENKDENEGVTSEQLEDGVEEVFEENEHLSSTASPDDEKTKQARAKFEETVQLLCRVAEDEKATAARSRRSAICYALNSKRTVAEIKTELQFDALCRLFVSVLTGCDSDVGGVANAKMCMMLAQTFYIVKDEDGSSGGGGVTHKRQDRMFVRSRLASHAIWKDDEFWDQALYQCVSESLTHSGVMHNFERTSTPMIHQRSEWRESQKIRWYDLNQLERAEAASQVHAVVFAQLGALAHSMMEFGCGIERACAFVRRMSVRNQLPLSQRTMLLQHLMGTDDKKK